LTLEDWGFDNVILKVFKWWIFLTILFLFSCNRGADGAVGINELPDTVSENFHQVNVSDTGRVEITSARVEGYRQKDVTVFSDAKFREIDSVGEVTLEGDAESIEIFGNQNGVARGGVLIIDHLENSSIEADYIEWQEAERTLIGSGNVRVETGDGLIVSGDKFIADVARKTYRFTDEVEGTLELSDED